MAISKDVQQKNGKVDMDKWAKKYMKTKPWGKTVTGGLGKAKPVKTMSNEDRRNLGLSQDKALEDFDENFK